MPTYEYVCRACDERTEVVQAFTDDPLTECPACGGELRKVFGNVGIAFKGTGFYRNDSRTKTSSKSNDQKGSSEAPTSSTSSEPATKAKSAPAEAAPSTSSSTSTAP